MVKVEEQKEYKWGKKKRGWSKKDVDEKNEVEEHEWVKQKHKLKEVEVEKR